MCKVTMLLLMFVCGIWSACSTEPDVIDEPVPTYRVPTPSGPELVLDETVVFSDDFDTFDQEVWSKETHQPGWVNKELQAYSPTQVSVGNDGNRTVLILTAERRNGKIVSGRVNSKGKKSFKYGTLEASIKLPSTANGLWPAFWMMGEGDNEWPACGEIDIMEMGDAEGMRSGHSPKRVNTAIHFGPDAAGHQQEYFAADANVDLQDGNYHVYRVDWTASEIAVSIDGKRFHTFEINGNPYFHHAFHMLFNLAVGGEFTGITNIAGITALKEGQKVTMNVDWVKISKTK